MFGYYRRSLLRLSHRVHELELDLDSNRQTCLYIQEELLKKLIQVENNINECRRLSGELQSQLRSREGRHSLNKSQAQLIKDKISTYYDRVNQYQLLITTFKTLADALAFIYLDKWDIKPQAFKQDPGFISRKAGLRWELKVLRLAFTTGNAAILHDLTNCLRYGDISIIMKNGLVLRRELKSGKKTQLSPRIKRQLFALQDIDNYLRRDKTNKLYGEEGEFTRITLHSPEVHHREKLNSIVRSAYANTSRYCLEEVEHGLHYGVACANNAASRDSLLNSLRNICSGSCIFSFVNELKYSGIGYYPFSLSIHDSDAWYDFCSGRLMVIIVVDFKVIKDKLESEGLSVKFDSEQDWVLEISARNQKAWFSEHFFGRLFAEFLSVDWFSQEIIHLVKEHPNHDIRAV